MIAPAGGGAALTRSFGTGEPITLAGGSQGVYTITNGLSCDGHSLHLSGPTGDPAVIEINVAQDSPVLSLTDCPSVHISNVIIRGVNDFRYPEGHDDAGYSTLSVEYEANHGIGLYGCENVVIDNVEVDSVYGDGLYIGGTDPSTGVAVTDLTVTGSGRHGIGLVNVDGFTLDGFTLTEGGTGGIDLEPNGATQSVNDVLIENFDIDTRRVVFPSTPGYDVTDVTIDGGVARHGLGSWPVVAVAKGSSATSAGPWVVRNLTMTYEIRTNYCVTFDGVAGVTIDGCTFDAGDYSTRVAGVGLANCSGTATIAGNDFDLMPAPYEVTGSPTPTVSSSGNTWQGGSD